MKLLTKYLLLIGAITMTLVSAGALLTSNPARASSASLSLTPGSGSVSQGANFSVGVYVNTGEPVNAVEINLTYPAQLLDFSSVESSSAFNVPAGESGGGGAVHIERGALPAVNGKQLVATVRFKAKASSGTAAIGFAGSSKVVSAGSNSNILSGMVGGSYILKGSIASPPAANLSPKENTTQLPSGRLEGAKLRVCQAREKNIKNIMSRITDRSQKQYNLYSAIYERTKALYKKQAKLFSEYDALAAEAESKKAAAMLALSALKASNGSFKCDGDNPKAVIINFKDKLAIEIDALTTYRTSVKYLVLGVKKAVAPAQQTNGARQ